MKKIKLVATSLVAAAMMLTGCGKEEHEHSFSKTWKSNDEQHWHECECGEKSDLGDHVDEDQNGKCDVCEKTVPVDPAIKSITISGSVAKLDLGNTLDLTATVKVVGGASTGVKWSVDKPELASLSSTSGKTVTLTSLKEGKVKVTAASTFDPSKSASVEIEIIDRGFDPSWIDMAGFAYSKEFPVEAIEEFLGEGEYEVVVPSDMLAGGAYYLEMEADDEGPACVVVVIDGALDESYAYDLMDAEFDRVYQTSFGTIEAVDPTGKYTVSFYCDMDEETYEYIAPTYFQFYKSEDVWESSKVTTDVAWDDAKIVNEDSDEIAIAKELVSKVPFVALGEDYSIEYIVDDSEYYYYIDILMMFGFTEEEAIEYMLENGLSKEALSSYYLSVYDYSIYEPFEGYDEVLLNAGFAHIEGEDEDGAYDYYELNDGLIAYDLSFGFTEAGNTIYMQEGVATLQAFPVNEANDFIENVLGSENRVVAYEETEGASFQAVIGEDEMDILVDYVDLSEAQAYADKLAELGFEVEYIPADDLNYPSWFATKGKLVVEFYLEQFEDEDTESYLDEGPLYFFIYADNTKHEEQGIYLPETVNTNVKVGSVTLDPELVKLGDSVNLTWTSSDEGVATVDADGVVTLLAGGEVDITVTTDVEIPEVGGFYSATTKLVVSEKPDFAPVLADLNDVLASYGGTEVLTAEEIPEIDCVEYDGFDGFSYYGCYVIQGYEPNETNESYILKLEELGFEVLEDEYGKYYETEEYEISFNLWPADEEGPACFQVCVYFKEAASEGATFDFSELSETSGSMNGFSFTTAKAGGQSAPAYNDNKSELRLYANNTITFTSEEPMTEIFFDANTCGESKATATFVSASTGSVSEVDGGFLWEGNATEVTLTVSGSGQIHINLIDINGGGSGGGGGGETSDLASFADEVSEVIFGEEGCLEYDSDYDEYWCAYYSEQSTLMDACTEICDLLAEVYDEYQAPTAGSDEDGDYVDACYGEGDYEIYVVTFEADGGIVFQIEVYESWY